MAIITSTVVVGSLVVAGLGVGGWAASEVGGAVEDTGTAAQKTLIAGGTAALGAGLGVALILNSPGGRRLLVGGS